MRISFSIKILLQVVLIILGFIASIAFIESIAPIRYLYLAVAVGAISAILLLRDVQTHNADKEYFKNQLFVELGSILNQIHSPIMMIPVIRYSVWKSQPEYVKIELLGADDHSRLEAFYRKVDKRNKLLASSLIEPFLEGQDNTLRHEIIEDMKRLFDEITWLRVRKNDVPWPTE
jgi:hypothetical protein